MQLYRKSLRGMWSIACNERERAVVVVVLTQDIAVSEPYL